ncbi:MAG: glycosyltransferase family 25 protein [Rhodobacteraceae bacterium]|nr:glycosyltransferase family 25 protein [Paracoccaceae bacterium]
MDTYLINLDRRPDRLAFIDAQLAQLGMPYTRISAADGSNPEEIGFPQDHPQISNMEYGCYLSHVKALKTFLQTDALQCMILEDDIILATRTPAILRALNDTPQRNAIIRLECPNNKIWKLPIRVQKTPRQIGPYPLVRLLSKTYGCAAYVISRQVAQQFLDDHAEPKQPIDVVMFGIKYLKNMPEILQLEPPPAIQSLYYNTTAPVSIHDSDINASRAFRYIKGWEESGPLGRILRKGLYNVQNNPKRIAQYFYRKILAFRWFVYDPE